MNKSVMELALGPAWMRLGPAVRTHYGITPGTADQRVMFGTMQVNHAPWVTPLLLLGRLFGALPQHEGSGIPVRVENTTSQESRALHWHRAFGFPGRPPLVFRSRMEYLRDDEIIEYVRWGLGIRLRLSERDGVLVYEGTRYQWDIGPLSLPIPAWLLLGKATIREWSLDNECFAMEFRIIHPLLGPVFSYAGEFRLSLPDRTTGPRPDGC